MKSFQLALLGIVLSYGGSLLAAPHPAAAPHESNNPNVERSEGWKEGEIKTPPFPEDADLLEVKLDYQSNFRYFIDSKNLVSTIDDYTIRYTLVTESSRGTRNVAFESMRCGSREYKTYAYGDAKKRQWRALPSPKWREIRNGGLNPYHHHIWEFYLCSGFPSHHYTEQEIVDMLKYRTNYERREQL